MVKRKEIEVLFERNTWELVNAIDVPQHLDVLKGRFVLALKLVETDSPQYKSRYVVQGHGNAGKHDFVHSSQTLNPSLLRTLCQVTFINNWKFWSTDIERAYIQGGQLQRDVYLCQLSGLVLDKTKLLKLCKSLYGLCNSGYHWYKILRLLLFNDLQIVSCTL